jgi:GGDEF domain-containing protein
MKGSDEEGKAAAMKLMDALNCCSDRHVTQAFIEELRHTHRTLQQRYGTLVIESILAFAQMNDEGWTDARNEAICKLAVKLREVCREENATYKVKDREQACLPFI